MSPIDDLDSVLASWPILVMLRTHIGSCSDGHGSNTLPSRMAIHEVEVVLGAIGLTLFSLTCRWDGLLRRKAFELNHHLLVNRVVDVNNESVVSVGIGSLVLESGCLPVLVVVGHTSLCKNLSEIFEREEEHSVISNSVANSSFGSR